MHSHRSAPVWLRKSTFSGVPGSPHLGVGCESPHLSCRVCWFGCESPHLGCLSALCVAVFWVCPYLSRLRVAPIARYAGSGRWNSGVLARRICGELPHVSEIACAGTPNLPHVSEIAGMEPHIDIIGRLIADLSAGFYDQSAAKVHIWSASWLICGRFGALCFAKWLVYGTDLAIWRV